MNEVKRSRLASVAVVLTIAAALVGGGGGKPGIATQHDPHDEAIDSRPIDWEHPLINGIAAAGPSDAARDLDFPPSSPRELGAPRRVEITAPPSAERVNRSMSMEFVHPDYGRFLVIQAVSQTNEAELAAIAARCLPETGCEAQASIELLKDGRAALLLEGPTATSITWLRGRVRFDVIGTAGQFTAEEARGVANIF